ncbi:hypothetical protein ACUODJ_18870, partial [Escherichia sp. HC-CC]
RINLAKTFSCDNLAIIAEFDTESEARQVLEQAPEWLNGFVAKGVNLSPLHRAML